MSCIQPCALIEKNCKPDLTEIQRRTALQDWVAIQRCKAFGPRFLDWCMQYLDLGVISMHLPSLSQVELIGHLVQFHTDAALQWDKHTWLQKLEFDRRLDQRTRGNSKAFARLKQQSPAHLQHLSATNTDYAILHCQPDGNLLLYLGTPDLFTSQQMVMVDGQSTKLLAQDQYSLIVQPLIPEYAWPDEVEVTRTKQTADAQYMMDELDRFWQTYWMVPQPDTTEPATLQAVLDLLPSDLLPADLDTKITSGYKQSRISILIRPEVLMPFPVQSCKCSQNKLCWFCVM